MIFYHFTALEYLEAIKEEGITKGDVPMTAAGKVGQEVNAVWLTTDATPGGHGLSDGHQLTVSEKIRMGVPVHINANFPNKRAVRIKVKWPASKAKQWLRWARGRAEKGVIDSLVSSGGGMAKAKTWHLSFEPIPPSAFLDIRVLGTPNVVEPQTVG
ncbi:hypothetical protein [Ruegeria sp. EL01]|uniref:hypothetical protein n=1 Tax=Ruegeria sp. EL01 TaxID=2107578 RepID=UPI000EA821CC|nr:hypothetical protein [Ruegeria sp. EL01]